jgi:hypothetical protein
MNKRRLRVLHTIHSLAGGGAERQLLLLCRLSATTSFEMAVFYVKDAGIDVSKIVALHVKPDKTPELKRETFTA